MPLPSHRDRVQCPRTLDGITARQPGYRHELTCAVAGGRIVAAVDIGTLIVRSPEIRGGRPRVAGTGVTVRTIAICHKSGLSAEEIADELRRSTLAHVHAALA